MTMLRALIGAGLLMAATGAMAQQGVRPAVDGDGTVRANAEVPLSSFLSPESKAWLLGRLTPPPPGAGPGGSFDVAAMRARGQEAQRPVLAKWQEIYPSTITPTVIGGVKTDVVEPKNGIDRANRHRVLINVHGGGFMFGNGVGALIEAIPVSGRGKIKVVTIDYRMAPEHTFPAASEDVAAVYRELLKTYKPANIGIYGCSAGGTLAGQAVAWFQKHNLPRPGVVGVFCSGLADSFWYGGDSAAIAPLMNATPPRPAGGASGGGARGYFEEIEQNDPLVSPAKFPAVLAQFPPTLFVTGTRDPSMSNAIVTHNLMLKAGVTAELFVQEGLGHGHFTLSPGTPETVDATEVIWKFFDRHLGKR